MWNIKFAIRSLKKSLGITFINILGFSLGLSVTFFIVQYLLNEYNYDSFHTDKERIYRVAVKSFNKDKFEAETYVYTSEAGTALKTDLPQVEQSVTITYPKSDIFYSENSPHKIENYLYASNDFFRLFSFSLKLGDPNKVLGSPYSLVVTEALAESIFGKQDPLGKQLILDNELYSITGVAANPPKNSDIQFNMLVSFSTRYKQKNVYMGWNGGNQYIHFVKLVPGATLGSFVEKAASFMWKYVNKNAEQYGGRDELYLQPLTRIHLYHNQESAALRRSMLVFLLVATMLLIVVIINFINLFVANSGKALKTLSVVKIHGASRFKMLKYLLSEVAILIATSILIALFLVWLFHPYFEQLAGKPVPNIAQLGVVQALVIVSVILAITLVSALFPSILISSVQPLKIIKNEAVARKSKNKLKDGLVIFQFFVSVLLIVSVLVSEKQIRYIQKFDLGYNKENILILPLQTPELQQKAALLKQETLKLRSIKSISAVSQVPNDGIEKNGYVPEGKTSPEMISAIDVDEDFLSLLNIQVTNGENFSQGKTTDDTGYLINETLAKKMGWNDPIGRVINRNGDHQIVGVVKDFNFASLRSLIQPLIITNKPWNGKFNYLLVKTGDGDISRTIKEIEEKWESISPNSLFEYSFLDQQFEQTYKAELSIGKLLKSLSVLTIFIALLGLIGLSKIITDSRVKEIGLRKVNGATIGNILMLLNRNYIALITASFILATPIAYYAMNRWLENFAYKTTLSWWIFALAGLLALGIALLTVSYQSWKAATKNPVEALRYE